MALKTDYKDFIPSTSTRFAKVSDESGTVIHTKVKLEDVTAYTQEGDTFGAADINATNTKVNEMEAGIYSNSQARNNILINSNFAVNQLFKSGTVTLAANEYGHDMWKAGASGCTYAFVTVQNIRTITIISGSLKQIIEGINFMTGVYTLSWVGTAQCRVDSGSYGNSGLNATLVGGTNSTVEIGIGTISQIKLEKGNTATDYVMAEYATELNSCLRYFWTSTALGNGENAMYGFAGGLNDKGNSQVFPVVMRATPTMTITGAVYDNCTFAGIRASIYGFAEYVQVTSTGPYRIYNGKYTADARL